MQNQFDNNFENSFNNGFESQNSSVAKYQKLKQDAVEREQESGKNREERPEVNKQGYYDSEIFDGGPLQSEIIGWKKQFTKVYSTNIEDDIFIWRPLNRFEYKQIMSTPNTNELMREEMICEICVLFPYGYCYEDMVNQAGGVPSMLAEQIMQKSGFTRKVSVTPL